MNQIDVNISPKVFNKVYLPYIDKEKRTQIYYGGSSSGKSVFLAQRAIYDLLRGGRNYLVCRQVRDTIRGSVAQEIGKVVTSWQLDDLFNINKTDGTITCIANDYQIIFAGLDKVEKLKSITPKKGAITDVWVEEATETEYKDIKQLFKRQRGKTQGIRKRLTLSFNPIFLTHWIYKTYFESIGWSDTQKEYECESYSILKTTYKDNDFLDQDDVFDLESENDQYFRDVYTLGKWGVLGHVIFTNWIVADLSDEKDQYYLPDAQRTNRRNGLDFGFSSDPAAMPVTHYDKMRKIIYVYNELYECGLTNDQLAIEISRLIGTDRLPSDSSEPKSIAELQKYGVNAASAKKGKDSVNFGIDWLKQHTIIIDKSCINMRNELSTYKWKEDAGGNALKTPVDKNNHLIDALRYAYEDDMDGFDYRSTVAFVG